MSYLIGMDGGGTKTKCVVTDFNFNTLYEVTGGPSTFLIEGTEKVTQNIIKLTEQSIQKLKIDYSDIGAILLGSTGAGRVKDAQKMEKAFKNFCTKQNIPIKNFFVESDARIALEGAFSGKEGSILIAGTGSIMFGKSKEGKIYRVGGCGRFIGDDGGGYKIGKLGLTALAKNFDKREPTSLLTKMLKEKLRIGTQKKLITEIYQNAFDIASVAPVVIKAAKEGDNKALEIIESQIEELILHIKAMKKNIKTIPLKISLIGGLVATENFYSKCFKEKIKDVYGSNVLIKKPDHSPQIGAAIMAKANLEKA